VKDFDSDDDEIDFPFGIALVICSKKFFLQNSVSFQLKIANTPKLPRKSSWQPIFPDVHELEVLQ